MSNSENTETLVPKIIEVESDSSTSTSNEQMFEEDNDTSSDQSVGNREEGENTSIIKDAIFMVPSVQTPASTSFSNLTIPVAIPLDPNVPKTIYVGVTTTDFTIRDIPDLSFLNREVDNSDSFDDVPKSKRQLPGDFALKKNTISTEMSALQVDMDRTEFRIFYMPTCPPMSNYYIPIPVDHFLSGLILPLDPLFCDFLHMIRSQPAHVHPNGVRYFIALTILCRRIGVDVMRSDRYARR